MTPELNGSEERTALAGPEQLKAAPSERAAAQGTHRQTIHYRIPFLVIVTGLIAAAIAVTVSVLQNRNESTRGFHGTVMNPPFAAYDFSLTNQRGETVTLSELRGKSVVVTFLYTSCAGVCPFVGIKLKMTAEMLGEEAGGVEFIAVSTDPQRDTPERATDYSRELGMYPLALPGRPAGAACAGLECLFHRRADHH